MQNCVLRATYGNGLNSVSEPDVYRVNNISGASIKDVNFAVVTSSDNGAVPIMKGYRTESTSLEWYVEGLQSISRGKLEDSNAL